MRRISILAAAICTAISFAACEDELKTAHTDDETDDGDYIEEVRYQVYFGPLDTTFIDTYTQFFKKVGNDIIYDPCLDSNIKYGYIDFKRYCKYDMIPALKITGDSIIYDVEHYGASEINVDPVAKVSFGNGYFVFSYSIFKDISCVHTCRLISSLSN